MTAITLQEIHAVITCFNSTEEKMPSLALYKGRLFITDYKDHSLTGRIAQFFRDIINYFYVINYNEDQMLERLSAIKKQLHEVCRSVEACSEMTEIKRTKELIKILDRIKTAKAHQAACEHKVDRVTRKALDLTGQVQELDNLIEQKSQELRELFQTHQEKISAYKKESEAWARRIQEQMDTASKSRRGKENQLVLSAQPLTPVRQVKKVSKESPR